MVMSGNFAWIYDHRGNFKRRKRHTAKCKQLFRHPNC
jgi:hypothetical protein